MLTETFDDLARQTKEPICKVCGATTEMWFNPILKREIPINVCVECGAKHDAFLFHQNRNLDKKREWYIGDLSGLTANRSEYQTWIDKKTGHDNFTGDKYTHDENTRIFKEKWKDVLPLYVEDDFGFRVGKQDIWEYKGDAITRLKG